MNLEGPQTHHESGDTGELTKLIEEQARLQMIVDARDVDIEYFPDMAERIGAGVSPIEIKKGAQERLIEIDNEKESVVNRNRDENLAFIHSTDAKEIYQNAQEQYRKELLPLK